MTSEKDDFWIDKYDPFAERLLTASEIQRIQKGREKRELIRQHCVEIYSTSPLYQARAAKDPDYWKTFLRV